VGHVSPEAASGGPIGLIRDGDTITIDLENSRLEVDLTDEQWAERRAGWTAPETRINYGYLRRYAKMVTSASDGAVLRID
jgi:dihydroxy-acid dehydratase